MTPTNNHLTPLSGFDPLGEVFIYKDRVLRGIFHGNESKIKEIFDTLQKTNLLGNDIVQTTIFNGQLPEDLRYSLILEHEKVSFISYAHEWTPSMLKDAALSQINLIRSLLKNDLVLKDCGMTTNVLFKGTKPVHVDFLSIIKKSELIKEDWLNPRGFITPFQSLWSKYACYFNQIFRAIFFPCMLYPLYLNIFKDYYHSVERIFGTHMNTSINTISENEVFLNTKNPEVEKYYKSLYAMEFSLIHENDHEFLNILEDLIKNIHVSIKVSAYSNYYDEKGENFDINCKDKWKDKQLFIDEALDILKPNTVLDIGANTGWFSMLAAQKGATVISIDNDVACMDILYEKAKSHNLNITPLVIDFINPRPDQYANVQVDDPHVKQSFFQYKNTPLILSIDKRLKCDMVFALAVIHHFVLGAGVNMSDCIEQIIKFCKHSLILEFVHKNDKLIKSEPTFFRAYYKNPTGFLDYTLQECLNILQRHFLEIYTKPLTTTRTLVVCSKKIQ